MTFSMPDFIERKRDGAAHTPEDLRGFVCAVRDAQVPDYQTSAWLMAAFLNGLDADELAAFTDALAHSGDTVRLPDGACAVDKHSTGGVGDKTTLIVAPLVAACGLRVAKLSGRGLGFTGGTVDKLASIPGFDTHLSTDRFVRQIGEIGVAVSGHSLDLAPAESKFYALRDVTGTVPSIPLIASSIVSKKIAGGAAAFVFDVKCGRGAFMEDGESAEKLARALVDLAATLGKKSVCLVTDMEQPLGEWVGNAVEVAEAIDVLSGRGPADTREVSLALAAEMLLVGGRAKSIEEAGALARRSLDDGEALRRFRDMVAAQGGDASVCENPERVLPTAKYRREIAAPRDGRIARMDARAIGNAVRAIGGGRLRKEDAVDLAVGVRLRKKTGARVVAGEPVLELLYDDEARLEAALPHIARAWSVAEEAAARPLIHGRVA